MTAAASGKKVVILGAGFGGLFAALEFEKTCRHMPDVNFDYKFKGEIVFLGRNNAVGDIFGRVVSGWPAFMMYQSYFLNQLMGFRNKLGTLIDWSYDYFYRRNTCKLD